MATFGFYFFSCAKLYFRLLSGEKQKCIMLSVLGCTLYKNSQIETECQLQGLALALGFQIGASWPLRHWEEWLLTEGAKGTGCFFLEVS